MEGLEGLGVLQQLSLEDNLVESLRGLEPLTTLMEIYLGNNHMPDLKEARTPTPPPPPPAAPARRRVSRLPPPPRHAPRWGGGRGSTGDRGTGLSTPVAGSRLRR